MGSTVVGFVNLETSDKGVVKETYLCQWYLNEETMRSITNRHTLPKPLFSRGSFSQPSWLSSFEATYCNGTFFFVVPYPLSNHNNTEVGMSWKMDSVSTGLITRNGNGVSLKTTPKIHPHPKWTGDDPLPFEVRVASANYPTPVMAIARIFLNFTILGKSQTWDEGNSQMKDKRAPLYDLIPVTFNTPELSDFRIVCEAESLLCHKYVLSVGSPVFKAMFLSETKEARKGVVTIVDVGKDVLKLMLAWMYGEDVSGKIESTQQRIELYKVADRYLLGTLKEALVEDIVKSVTPETAFETYVLGNVYSEERFKAKATEVMKKDRDKVFSNEEVFHDCYKRFPGLLLDVLKDK